VRSQLGHDILNYIRMVLTRASRALNENVVVEEKDDTGSRAAVTENVELEEKDDGEVSMRWIQKETIRSAFRQRSVAQFQSGDSLDDFIEIFEQAHVGMLNCSADKKEVVEAVRTKLLASMSKELKAKVGRGIRVCKGGRGE